VSKLVGTSSDDEARTPSTSWRRTRRGKARYSLAYRVGDLVIWDNASPCIRRRSRSRRSAHAVANHDQGAIARRDFGVGTDVRWLRCSSLLEGDAAMNALARNPRHVAAMAALCTAAASSIAAPLPPKARAEVQINVCGDTRHVVAALALRRPGLHGGSGTSTPPTALVLARRRVSPARG
jgi:hypothetical protein